MPQAGDIITLGQGPYRLLAPLGGSSYGLVWRAAGPQGEAALKFVNREQMERAQPDQRAHWTSSADNEIAFLRALSPWDERHVVRLLDWGVAQGLPVLALERMDCDLAAHVTSERNAGRPIPLGQVLRWLAQVNQALAKVHQYGWRYLDLKPANLLLPRDRQSVKLADFGTNRLLADVHPHSYAGTANWQAPEQFFPTDQHTYDTDARTDYFALGAMFYYLVSGGVPLRFCSDCGAAYRAHRSGGAFALRERHGRAMPPTLRQDEADFFAHRIDRACAAGAGRAALVLLQSLLQADRARRPRNAVEISRMIGAIRRDAPERTAPPPYALARRELALAGWR